MEKVFGQVLKENKFIEKIYALFLSLFIIVGVLFSSVEITEEIHHSCHETSCQLCYEINLAKSFISGLNLGENLDFFVFASFAALTSVVLVKSFIAEAVTLVSLKVELLN